MQRRTFLSTVGSGLVLGHAPGFFRRDAARPQLPSGVACGDVTSTSAVIWSRCDGPGRMLVEIAGNETFRDAKKLEGPDALEGSDCTAKLALTDLPPSETLFYRVSFEDLNNPGSFSLPAVGSFRTAPAGKRDVLFAWSGDTVGQGFGIDLARGGMKTYETIRKLKPDFFIHSGDTIYADNPLVREITLPDMTVWKNVVTDAKSKVAETLAEFHGNFAYNLLDENVRRFCAEVPLLVQWDDHEVRNNWYPGQQLKDDERYKVKSCSLLAARARQAFFDYLPIADEQRGRKRIYRHIPYGPSLDVFMLDARSYRGPNTKNRQKERDADTAYLGDEQLAWLKAGLKRSKATWKVIAHDMPIGLLVGDKGGTFENAANGNGPPLGRELELAELFRFLKEVKIANLVWLTADVHYAAAHYYDPEKAQFKDFDPFWEFIAGPLHAGSFGPGQTDNTFGPQVKFHSKQGKKIDQWPNAESQTFGTVTIDGKSEAMTVTLWNAGGEKLHTTEITPSI